MENPINIDIISLPCIDDKRRRYKTLEKYPKLIGIYKITSPNMCVYIGLSKDIYYRIYTCYKKLRCKSQHKIYNSLIKYGVENHKFEIIHIVDNEKELPQLEIDYIKKFNSFYGDNDSGLNLTRGGDRLILTDETRNIMNQKKIGRLVSDETRKKLSIANLGKKLSKEHKKKISSSNKGKVFSDETRKRMRESQLGMKHTFERTQKKIGVKHKLESIEKRVVQISGENHWTKKLGGHREETKLKISNSLKGRFVGEKNPAFGKHLSDEQKLKISLKKTGVKRSLESRLKQSKSISGENHHNYGKKATLEFRKKLSDAHKKINSNKPEINNQLNVL